MVEKEGLSRVELNQVELELTNSIVRMVSTDFLRFGDDEPSFTF